MGAFVSKRPLQRSRAVLKPTDLTLGCKEGSYMHGMYAVPLVRVQR